MKKAAGVSRHRSATDPVAGQRASAIVGADLSTRDRVTQLLLEQGATTAAQLGSALGLSPAAIRRHLDAMLADGDVIARDQTIHGHRGRGRPAKVFVLTEAARIRCGTHHYDNMATAALRWIARNGGSEAVQTFAAEQVSALE
ncbi:helix-turn-helix transcriptional regulator, partial [Micromonospora azadirachtae]